MSWYSWPAAGILLLCTLGAELLPVCFGTGSQARLDWSFAYVTLHFIALPTLSAVLLPVNLIAFIFRRSRPLTARLIDLSSVAVPTTYLTLLSCWPLPFLELLN